jgi:hypothetical protein
MADQVNARMRQLVGTTSDWSANDIVLGSGEIAIEMLNDQSVRMKVGNGTRPFSLSPYVAIGLNTIRGASNDLLNELPPPSSRAGKILSFAAGTGQPIATAPVTGDATDLANSLAGARGTNQVGWTNLGTGAVTRMTEARLRETCSAWDYAAKGDGAQDDTAYLQAAINYAQSNNTPNSSTGPAKGPQVLFIPSGYYKVTGTLNITGRIDIRGEASSEFSSGTRIVKTTPGDLFWCQSAAGGQTVAFEDLTLINTSATGTGHLINVVPSPTAPGYNSYRIRRCCFANPQSMSMRLYGDDIQIENCTFDVSGYSGNCIQLGSNTAGDICSNVRITGCDFFNVVNHCILLYQVKDVVVNNNCVSQPDATSKTFAFVDGADSMGSMEQGITVVGNVLYGTRRVLGLYGATNVTFAGNTCWNGGIGASEIADAILLMTGAPSSNIVIASNVIQGGYGAKSAFNYNGTAHTNVAISDNVFVNAQATGVAINAGSITGSVSNNVISGWATKVAANDYLKLGYRIPGFVAVPFGANITLDASAGMLQWTQANSTSPFTVANPTNPSDGQQMTFTIYNGAGAALGAITWGSLFRLGSAFTLPAAGQQASITFAYLAGTTHWIEIGRSAATVPV